MRIYYIIAKAGFQRDNVPLAGLGGAQYESSRSDTFLDRLREQIVVCSLFCILLRDCKAVFFAEIRNVGKRIPVKVQRIIRRI